ncbi:MAG TPA: hypothetical protein VGD43_17790 [Micromonospora sp.]
MRHLPVLLIASAVLMVVAAAVGGLTRGGAGAAGAAAGVGVVVFSYTLTTVMLAWADATNPQLVMPFGLALYATKFTLFGVVMAAVASTGWPGLVPLAFGVCVGVLVWTGTHVWWLVTVHARRPRQS